MPFFPTKPFEKTGRHFGGPVESVRESETARIARIGSRQRDKLKLAGKAKDSPQRDPETPTIHDALNGNLGRFGWSVRGSGICRFRDNFVSILPDRRTMSTADVVRNPLTIQIFPDASLVSQRALLVHIDRGSNVGHGINTKRSL